MIIKVHALLDRFETMRLSEWQRDVLFVRRHDGSARIDGANVAVMVGAVKFEGRPFALRLKARDRPWVLFVETGEAANELAKRVEEEAVRQRPSKPITETR